MLQINSNVNQLRTLLAATEEVNSHCPISQELIAAAEQLTPFLAEVQSTQNSSKSPALLKTIEQKLQQKNYYLSPGLKSRLFLADRFFHHFIKSSMLHQVFTDILNQLHIPVITAALANDNFFWDTNNSLRQFIYEFYYQGVTWYPTAGKTSSQFPQRLAHLIDSTKPVYQHACLEKFREYIASETSRSEKIEHRIRESELGIAKITNAHEKVIKFINEHIGYSELPQQVADFIHNTWRPELQFIQINLGQNCEPWVKWKRILQTLSWVFKPDKDKEEKQRAYSEIPKVMRLLEQRIEPQTCSIQEYQTFVSAVEHSLMQTLKGETVECIEVALLGKTGFSTEVNTHISQSLLQKVAKSISEGDWFVLSVHNSEPIRCKLSLRFPDTDQLLFVNRTGQKVLQKSMEEFSMYLSSKICRPLPTTPPFKPALTKAISDLISFNKKIIARAGHEKKARMQIEQQAVKKRAKHLEAEALVRKNAADKARREAAALATQKTDEGEQPDRQPGIQQERERAQQLLDELHVGARVEIPDTKGTPTQCKLAVRIRSSGKHIFVDRLGTKIAEYNREELIELLTTKAARVFDQGENFETQLAKIVRGLRKDAT